MKINLFEARSFFLATALFFTGLGGPLTRRRSNPFTIFSTSIPEHQLGLAKTPAKIFVISTMLVRWWGRRVGRAVILTPSSPVLLERA
jgi:hypothetical protein